MDKEKLRPILVYGIIGLLVFILLIAVIFGITQIIRTISGTKKQATQNVSPSNTQVIAVQKTPVPTQNSGTFIIPTTTPLNIYLPEPSSQPTNNGIINAPTSTPLNIYLPEVKGENTYSEPRMAPTSTPLNIYLPDPYKSSCCNYSYKNVAFNTNTRTYSKPIYFNASVPTNYKVKSASNYDSDSKIVIYGDDTNVTISTYASKKPCTYINLKDFMYHKDFGEIYRAIDQAQSKQYVYTNQNYTTQNSTYYGVPAIKTKDDRYIKVTCETNSNVSICDRIVSSLTVK